MFSSSGEITNIVKPPRKHRIQKKITNTFFEDMKKYNDEEFWDNILTRFSRNNFFNDYRYIGSTLYYKIRSKNQKDEIYINPDNLENTFEELKMFLRKKGVIPIKEVIDDSNDLIGDRPKIESWKDAGKNQIILLHDYINKIKKDLDLSNKEVKHLESILKITIYNSIIGNDHITIEDEKITKISNILFDSNSRKFSLDIDNIKIKSVKHDKKVEDKFYTITSFSDDKHITINKEVEIESIDKKWEEFLNQYYNV
jgi:hypothetical protein